MKLTEMILSHFKDANGGFFDTRDDHEELLFRPKDIQDNATPSGNALAACALLQMAAYEGRKDWYEIAETMLCGTLEAMGRYPTAFAQWLQALDFVLGPTDEVAVVGDPANLDTLALISVLWKVYRPRLLAAISADPPAPGSPSCSPDVHCLIIDLQLMCAID